MGRVTHSQAIHYTTTLKRKVFVPSWRISRAVLHPTESENIFSSFDIQECPANKKVNMARSQWSILRQRLNEALAGRNADINRLYTHPEQEYDAFDMVQFISPVPVNEDIVWNVIEETMYYMNRRSTTTTPFLQWFLQHIFRVYPSIQLAILFQLLISNSTLRVTSQEVQFRNMMMSFPHLDLMFLIPADAFDQPLHEVVLDCDRPNPNFLASIACTSLWELLDPIPFPETYRQLITAIFIIAINLNILNPDLSLRFETTQRISRTMTERSTLIQRIGEYLNLNMDQLNQEATSLSPDWVHEVESHWQQNRFRNWRGRIGTPRTPDLQGIIYVDHDEYTLPVAEGPLDADIYRSFFDIACQDDARLDALREILSQFSYAAQDTLAIPTEVLSGTRQDICAWLAAQQNERSKECSNANDPFTLTPIEDIPLLFLWQQRTLTNHIHCFDLIALYRHLQNDTRNPLTQERFAHKDIEDIRNRYGFIYELMRAVRQEGPQ